MEAIFRFVECDRSYHSVAVAISSNHASCHRGISVKLTRLFLTCTVTLDKEAISEKQEAMVPLNSAVVNIISGVLSLSIVVGITQRHLDSCK